MEDLRGLPVLPKRRIVDCTFAWLVRDCEQSETSAAAIIGVAMIRLRLPRLA